MFNSPWAYYRDDDPVPIELSFDHPYKGLGNIFIDRSEGATEDELRDFIETKALPSIMSSGSPIASLCELEAYPSKR